MSTRTWRSEPGRRPQLARLAAHPAPTGATIATVSPHARAIALAAVLAILATAGPADAHRTTTVTVYRAFTASGSPAVRVRHARGSCFTSSETTSRSDAWRCTVGNVLYDPCFSSRHAHGVVICPNADPASGLEIRLTKRLPIAFANRGSPSAGSQPWRVELYSGAHCAFSGGASSVIDGLRLNYFCPGDPLRGLWGYPRRSTQPWTIFSAPFTATTLTERVAVEHAWT